MIEHIFIAFLIKWTASRLPEWNSAWPNTKSYRFTKIFRASCSSWTTNSKEGLGFGAGKYKVLDSWFVESTVPLWNWKSNSSIHNDFQFPLASIELSLFSFQVPEIREQLLKKNKNMWEKIAKHQMKHYFNPSGQQLKNQAEMYVKQYKMCNSSIYTLSTYSRTYIKRPAVVVGFVTSEE